MLQKQKGYNKTHIFVMGSLFFLSLLVFFNSNLYAWTTSNGVAVCTANNNQTIPRLVSDTAGGAIITWQDSRNGNDIYAQRINSNGSTLWTLNGNVISTAASNQENPVIESDSSGGAIIAWQDQRSGTFNVYAQRVNSSGSTLWTLNGVSLSTTAINQQVPQICSDGVNGAIIVWEARAGSGYFNNNNYEIYAQRINSSGSTLWALSGVAICTATNNQELPQIISDGSGGAFITWEDQRSGNFDIYAQHINSSGSALWTLNGVAICTAANNQQSPQLASDSAGGAFIVWQDQRSGGGGFNTNYDIYAQRVNGSGSTLWTLNGVAICTAKNAQQNPQIINDGAGGAIIAWQDQRNGSGGYFGGGNYDIYAQRVNSSGSTLWTFNGVELVSTPVNSEQNPQLVSDGSNGAIVVWQDSRSDSDDIYAQRITAVGTTQWNSNGVIVCAAASSQTNPRIIQSAVPAGSIIVWQDERNGNNNYDIYAQSLDANGFSNPVPPTAGFFGIPTVGVGPFTVNFIDTSSNNPSNWTWNFGDGSSTTGVQYPTHTYNAVAVATSYTVQLIVSNIFGAATSTLTNYIEVVPPVLPSAGFFATPTVGVGPFTVNFIDTSSNEPTSWSWNFGDGIGTDTVQFPAYTYSSVGSETSYTVTLIVSNSEGSSTAVQMNYITVLPAAVPNAGFFATPTSGIGPLSVNFVDTSSNDPFAWQWSFGDGGSDSTQFPNYVYAQVTVPTYYSVQLIAANTFGIGSVTLNNYIYVTEPSPIAAFTASPPTSGYGALTVQFTDLSSSLYGAVSWLWNFGDGSTSTLESPLHVYGTVSVPTTYTVQLIVTTPFGVVTSTQTNFITVTEPAPSAGFSASTTSGYGALTVQFTDLSSNTPTSWSWNFGDGNTSNNQSPSYVYGVVSVPTTYTVTLIATNAYGSGTVTQTNYISVTEPAPVASFYGAPTSGLGGSLSVNFTDTSYNLYGVATRVWNFGDGGSSISANPTHNYNVVSNPTSYSVSLIVTTPFGTNTSIASNYIFVTEPSANAGFYGSLTSGVGPLSVNFTDTSANTPTSWFWEFGDGSIDTVENPSYTYAAVTVPTSYTVTLIATNAYGSSTITKPNYISVIPALNAGFYGTPNIGNTPLTVNFVDTSAYNITSWSWNFGDGNTSNSQNPSHTYAQVTVQKNYTVTLIVSNVFGSSTAIATNYITAYPGLHTALPDIKLFFNQALPNAFNINDFVSVGATTSYSVVSNFLTLTSLSNSTVNEGGYATATVGTNAYEVDGTLGTVTVANLVKWSTYKIAKLPKVGLNVGSSYTLNVAGYTSSTGDIIPPPSFGNSSALLNSDTTLVSAVWSGNTAVTITALASVTGVVNVDVIASPNANPPFGVDIDKERIQVYTNILPYSTFSIANDTTAYGLELAPGKVNLASQSWLPNYTDGAGTQANGIWAFNFADSNSGVKATLYPQDYISMSSATWYTGRMRVVADSNNNHQAIFYLFTNGVGNTIQTDIAANAVFGIPTVWTWIETPILSHGSTLNAYPQIFLKAGGPGNVYIDEIQVINSPPTLVDAERGNTRLYYPYGDFEVASETTGWGQELYSGAGGAPAITVTATTLRLDFTGAGQGSSQLGIKWTANNAVPGTVYTAPAIPGREVGARLSVFKESGNFNSLTLILVAAYGVQTNGQSSIGISPSNLVANAEVGVEVDGDIRAVGGAVDPFYQFQFGVRSNQPGVLHIANVDLDVDNDDPYFGDSALFQ